LRHFADTNLANSRSNERGIVVRGKTYRRIVWYPPASSTDLGWTQWTMLESFISLLMLKKLSFIRGSYLL